MKGDQKKLLSESPDLLGLKKLPKFHLFLEQLWIATTAQKMKFSVKDFLSKMLANLQFPVDFATFPREILNGKLYFFVQCAFQFLLILIEHTMKF